eukprot:1622829-Ditylum_brightwellii.AAC.1
MVCLVIPAKTLNASQRGRLGDSVPGGREQLEPGYFCGEHQGKKVRGLEERAKEGSDWLNMLP